MNHKKLALVSLCCLASYQSILPTFAPPTPEQERQETIKRWDQRIIALARQKQYKIPFEAFNKFYKNFWDSIKERWIKEQTQRNEQTHESHPEIAEPAIQDQVNLLRHENPKMSESAIREKAKKSFTVQMVKETFEHQKTYYDKNKISLVSAIQDQLNQLGTDWVGQKFRTDLHRWLQGQESDQEVSVSKEQPLKPYVPIKSR